MKIFPQCMKVLALFCLPFQFAGDGWTQSYPAKTVRYVVPSSPGVGNDTIARVFAEGLAQVFSQQVVVENRAGAAGNIAAETVARAPADGYTLLQISQSHAVNVTLYRGLRYDLVRDFAGVTLMAVEPYVVVVHPSLPVKSINDLIKLAKARPGALNFPSAGTGTTSFLSGELFKNMTGVNMVHVPYKGGGPALISVVSGETSIYFGPVPPAMPHIRLGRLRAIAVGTTTRLAVMPELPTVAEAGVPGYELANWFGLVVPAQTPKDILETIHRAAVTVLNKPNFSKRFSDMGLIPLSSRPDEFAAYIKSKIEMLAKIIRQTGATVN